MVLASILRCTLFYITTNPQQNASRSDQLFDFPYETNVSASRRQPRAEQGTQPHRSHYRLSAQLLPPVRAPVSLQEGRGKREINPPCLPGDCGFGLICRDF